MTKSKYEFVTEQIKKFIEKTKNVSVVPINKFKGIMVKFKIKF